MTTTPTQVAAAAAERFRVLRERATAKLAKAKVDAAELRARVQRESTEMMAKRRKEGGDENRLVSPWPDERKPARYEFDDADHPTPDTDSTRRPGKDEDDDNNAQVDTWLN